MKETNMKKIMLFIVLMCMGIGAYAINYPAYKPSSRDRQMQGQATMHSAQGQPIGGYSTVATGGTTTFGEGSAIGGPSRIAYDGSGPAPSNPRPGDTWGDKVWNPDTQQWEEDEDTEENPSDPYPVGGPVLPMLFFAMLAAGAVYLRRRQAQA